MILNNAKNWIMSHESRKLTGKLINREKPQRKPLEKSLQSADSNTTLVNQKLECFHFPIFLWKNQ